MISIARAYEIDLGHCLPDHDGQCHRPHGHRYRILASISGPVQEAGSSTGMVLDFSRLKEILATILDPWDHRFVMSQHDKRLPGALDAFGWDEIISVPFPPTAERLAAQWGAGIASQLGEGIQLDRVRVFETPTCWADWTP